MSEARGLCESCLGAIRAMSECPARVTGEWSCPACGEQSFYKDADEAGSEGPGPTLVQMTLIAGVAATLIAWIVTGGVK